MHPKTLIVCDVQPEVVKKLPQPRLFCDVVNLAVAAARQHGQTRILYTQLKFDSYDTIPPTHPRLGVLRKLPATVKWFTSSDLCIAGTDNNKHQEELILPRTTFLPQADTPWTDAFNDVSTKDHQVTVVGYGPTVQTVCHLLGDILALPNVDIIRECVADETPARCQAFLNHGLLFRETVITMTDYLESLDLLHERIETSMDLPPSAPPPNQYVCDVGRGGHLSLFMPYITNKYGYCQWPTQPWYQEGGLSLIKQYYCPLGRWVIPLCDEPQFGSGPRFFLMGRQFLDEKDLLFDLVPELMPPTFHRLEEAKEYLAAQGKELLWFLKKVNQNGGRAVDVLKTLPTQPLAKDDQLQAHIPRPLLWEGGLKCHVKTYYYLSACQLPNSNDVEWQLYLHDLFYLAVASKPWSTEDLSDECQITTMRLQRLPADHPWRIQWKLSELCPKHLETIMTRAIQQSKLQVPVVNEENSVSETRTFRTLQFEINSADWMLDEDGRIYLIECNGIPVLYDGGQSQPLCTRGLQLYDSLYKKDPQTAVVNDHDLLEDSVDLAMTGKVPATSLWKLVAAIPAVKTT
ncbi:expressed unknown protein [Seminavis robusta]|uniref:Uncharacterized protein n=1 Tax=Seminavis robusta TaxID=568900 RepID=A0A9N8HTU8_9STRA|nr:expressed unknown protein [Seminavis robusta]|eukprot:Sro1648_g288480.1 n/a (574) ;mRNA; f:11486-13207